MRKTRTVFIKRSSLSALHERTYGFTFPQNKEDEKLIEKYLKRNILKIDDNGIITQENRG